LGEVRKIRATSYVRGGGIAGFTTIGKRWARVPEAGRGDRPDDFAPSTVLKTLRAASIETERLRQEDVRGEPTVRYRLTVSCEQADLVWPGETTTTVDVWVYVDGLVRRIAMHSEGTHSATRGWRWAGRRCASQVLRLLSDAFGRSPIGARRSGERWSASSTSVRRTVHRRRFTRARVSAR
jgi:hypothetical protein